MIYRSVENPACRLCAFADMPCSGNVNCSVRGTVPADYLCRKFKYDIFKREIKPKPKKKIKQFSPEDFLL